MTTSLKDETLTDIVNALAAELPSRHPGVEFAQKEGTVFVSGDADTISQLNRNVFLKDINSVGSRVAGRTVHIDPIIDTPHVT